VQSVAEIWTQVEEILSEKDSLSNKVHYKYTIGHPQGVIPFLKKYTQTIAKETM
jgi:hypothetical protein